VTRIADEQYFDVQNDREQRRIKILQVFLAKQHENQRESVLEPEDEYHGGSGHNPHCKSQNEDGMNKQSSREGERASQKAQTQYVIPRAVQREYSL